VIDARERVRQSAGDSPVLLKIAPDLSLTELDDVVQIARSRRIDGMIVGNTTLARPSTLREQNRAKEQGGLSGRVAVSAVDTHGGGDLCSRRRRVSACRRRRQSIPAAPR